MIRIRPGLNVNTISRSDFGARLRAGYGIENSREIFRPVRIPTSKFKPREDQKIAIENVNTGFEKHTRGQLILPCGTGKTLTGLWIKEKEQARTTIVAVPSIALIKQTKDAWAEQKTQDFDYLCICSDDSVDSSDDSLQITKQELDQDESKVTTDVRQITNFLKKTGKDKVIYTTYQSLEKLIEANKSAQINFDLALIDEAHKTTGQQGDLFTLIHDDNNLQISKRLYMTATPKIASDSDSGELIADMSNEEIYGPEFHRMSFGEAIERGILTDYHVIAVGVTDETLKDPNYLDKVNSTALDQVMSQYGAHHALSFHSRVTSAENFANTHTSLFPRTLSLHVNGSHNTHQREQTLNRFKKTQAPNRALLTNAKCLTEGVDVPAIDLVYFCDPKTSTVDIVQAAGRALRKDKNKPNKVGYIVVPILHKPGEEVAEVVARSSFKNLVRVLQSLGSTDERLVARLCLNNRGESTQGETSLPQISIEGIDDKNLRDSIFSEIINKTGNRLKTFLYANFDSAVDRIKEQQPTRPSPVSDFLTNRGEYQDRGLKQVLGLGRNALKTLAIKAGRATDRTTIAELADLIWGGGERPQDFDSAVVMIKKNYPNRPINVSQFFESQGHYKNNGLEEAIEMGFAALKTLAIRAGKATQETTAAELADLIWGGEKPQNFNSAVEMLKRKYPNRPINITNFFKNQGEFRENGLNQVIGIGFEALRRLAITANLATDGPTMSKMADLIWGEVEKPQNFDLAVTMIKKKQPDRPTDVSDFFNNRGDYRDNGLQEAISMGFKALKTLAITANLATDGTTMSKMADLIWGEVEKPQNFNSAVQAIKKKQPDRPKDVTRFFHSQDNYRGKGLTEAIGMGLKTLKNLAITANLATDGTTMSKMADLIWGVEKPQNFDSLVIKIKEKQPNRPTDVSRFFRSQGIYRGKGLTEAIGIGYHALNTLAIKANQATDGTTHAELANLIWG